ncbi:TNR18 factor, partial [Brachypteracias leptosomus]|nr:TNR18 factor [Brachypteracias leptosomus]
AGDSSRCQTTESLQKAEEQDCRCFPGYSCADSPCSSCTKLPDCSEGQELARIGHIDFSFQCEPCEIGTYSNVRNGWCRNWTDCESSGLVTVRQGNRTHNTVC